jgi:hypothetical protein
VEARSVAEHRPGRFCPAHYRYDPRSLARPPEIAADTLYVAGGLYGNLPALDAIERLAGAERGETRVVCNGDFNWFDVDADAFREVNERVLRHHALRGNVETELASEDDGAGCGCAYPETVSDAEVDRSNAILARLRDTARRFPALRAALAALPMHAVAAIGGARIAIVHGDAESLAGWGFAHDRLDDPVHQARLGGWLRAAQVDVFACSHTCLPACRTLRAPDAAAVVINNGAAGMPNFAGTRFGVVTRISAERGPPESVLYGTRTGDVHVEALRVDYDPDEWLRQFLGAWPEGSPAHRSYFDRITAGPRYAPDRAMPAEIRLERGRFT